LHCLNGPTLLSLSFMVSIFTGNTTIRIPWRAFTLCLGLCLFLTATAYPCRYTVRDSGFVDTGHSTWRLFLYTDSKTHDETKAWVDKEKPFLNTNIRVKVVNTDQDDGYPRFEEVTDYPAGVLVAPDGKPWVLPPIDTTHSIQAGISDLFKSLAGSPVREKLLRNLIDSFCVVLLVEGVDPNLNESATKEAVEAMERIKPYLPNMAKPVDTPPNLLILSQAERKAEEVLLRTLGIEDEERVRTHVAVLFGRGCRIGPLLTDDGITESRLFTIFQVVGADCECDLNPAWLSGPVIPLIWDRGMRADAAERLGFDPENPVVRMEVSRIVAGGQYRRIDWGEDVDESGPLLEEDVEEEDHNGSVGGNSAFVLFVLIGVVVVLVVRRGGKK